MRLDKERIDIIIPWVDGDDLDWQKSKEKAEKENNINKNANSSVRYESWDNLQYIFRGIEKFMPWVDRVFFVTCGHLPKFLNLNNPKLRVIKHSDYIPGNYLPTFNSNVIELNYHRIEELSNNFILFNDDCFPLKPLSTSYYFINGIPCDEAIETPIIPIMSGEISKYTWNVRALNISLINRNFNKREVQKKNPDKWFNECYGSLLGRNESLSYWDNFVGFRDPHVPVAFKKSTFEKVWERETEILDMTCMSKFRNMSCVNQWLMRYWQLCEGDFHPRRTNGKSYVVTVDNCKEIADVIRKQKEPMICINEECTTEEFEIIKKEINAALDELFPDKSSYER